MHTRIQLDITAELSVREGENGTYEIVVLDPHSESSTVLEVFPAQAQQILDGLAARVAQAETARNESSKAGAA